MGIANSSFSWIIEKSMDRRWLDEHELFRKIWEEATDKYGSITLYDELIRYEKYRKIIQDEKDKNKELDVNLSDCIQDNFDLIYCQNTILGLANDTRVATYNEYMEIYSQGYTNPKGKRKKVITIEDIYNRLEKKIDRNDIDFVLGKNGKESDEEIATRIEKEIADSIENSNKRMETNAGLKEKREFSDMQWVGGLMSFPLNKGYKSRLFSEIKQLAASQYVADDPSSWYLRKAIVFLIHDLAQIVGIPQTDENKEEKPISEIFEQLKKQYKTTQSSPKMTIRELARNTGLPIIDSLGKEIKVEELFIQLQKNGVVKTAETPNKKNALADCTESQDLRMGTITTATSVILEAVKPSKTKAETQITAV